MVLAAAVIGLWPFALPGIGPGVIGAGVAIGPEQIKVVKVQRWERKDPHRNQHTTWRGGRGRKISLNKLISRWLGVLRQIPAYIPSFL